MLMYPAVAISFMILYIFMYNRQEMEMLQNEAELTEERLNVLIAQIQPHFIFNSLFAIQELCEEDGHKAAEAVGNFAYYLRSNLESLSSRQMIPFLQELEHIKHYIALEKADPSNKMTIIYELEVTDFRLPALSVQPIVENAVRHGLGARVSDDGVVTIATTENESEILVTVADNGMHNNHTVSEQENRRSIGIENVRERLRLQCGGSIDIQNEEVGTKVTIRIPKQR